ncbi:hypothetical protein ACLOAU_16240 [Niabella sp. CJ426]|uniref:hypothetical protein n=1 Tax=Niabella sp. CJ426 TaxID=3393740 RepID=UPI003CFD7A4E
MKKLLLSLSAIIIASIAFVAFKPQQKTATMSTLYFKYQLNTYTAAQVSSQANWKQIEPSEACEQESNQKACTFSIEVPDTDEPLYLNGTQPSSRVLIDAASSGSSNYVSNVRDNVGTTPPTIAKSIENISE